MRVNMSSPPLYPCGGEDAIWSKQQPNVVILDIE